mgnify:CR=1 FL=1
MNNPSEVRAAGQEEEKGNGYVLGSGQKRGLSEIEPYEPLPKAGVYINIAQLSLRQHFMYLKSGVNKGFSTNQFLISGKLSLIFLGGGIWKIYHIFPYAGVLLFILKVPGCPSEL